MTIGHDLGNGSELGWLVSNHLIRRAASQGVQQAANSNHDITLLAGEKVSDVRTSASAASVTLSSGQTLHCRLVVAADSRFQHAAHDGHCRPHA